MTVSGTAENGDLATPIPVTVTIPAGSTSFVIPVDAIADGSVEGTEDLIVTASIANPGVDADADITVDVANASGTVTITDDDSAIVTVDLANSDLSAGEPGDNGFVRFTLSTPSTNPVEFSYNIGGSAVGAAAADATGATDADYAALSGTATIPAGATYVDVPVTVFDDPIVELDENVTIELDAITSASGDVTADASAPIGDVTITSDDTATLFFDLVNDGRDTDASETGPDNGTLVARLSNPVAFGVSAGYSIGGTASNSSDYNSISGSLFFAAGVTEIPIDILVVDDADLEGSEDVTLELTDILTPGASDPGFSLISIIGADTATMSASDTVTIEDNDGVTAAVAGIFVNGTDWADLFRDRLDGVEDGPGTGIGYQLNGELTVPWINIDQIIVQFDSAIDASSVDVSDFVLTGIPGFNSDFTLGDIPTIDTATVGPNNTVVLQFAASQFLEPAQLFLDVNASGITFSGQAGSDTTEDFIALPGDANQDGIVNGADLTDIADRQGSLILPGDFTFLNYEFFSDVNGDAIINGTDLTEVVDRQGSLVLIPSSTAASFSLDSDSTEDQNSRSKPVMERSRVLSLSGSIDSNFKSQDKYFAEEISFEEGKSEELESSKFDAALINDLVKVRGIQ